MPRPSDPYTSIDVRLYLNTNKQLRFGVSHDTSDLVRCIVPSLGSRRHPIQLRGDVLGRDIGSIGYRVLGHNIDERLHNVSRENRELRGTVRRLINTLKDREAELSRLKQRNANLHGLQGRRGRR